MRVALVACLVAFGTRATAGEVATATPTSSQRAWAAGAAVVPGVVMHGAGHWVLGDHDTAQRLLLAEGVGLGLVASGGVVLALTGASRYLAGPAALTVVGGFGLFGVSFLADVYGVLAPEEGWGRAPALPLATALVGGVYVAEPQFDLGFVTRASAEVLLGRWRFEGAFDVAPAAALHRERGVAGYRLWQPEPNATWLELAATLGYLDHAPARFTAWTGEVELVGRLGLERLAPTLRGAFSEMGAGVALREVRYPNARRGSETLLLARFGFGVYLGDASEAQLYYDHRHDGFAAGLLLPGIPSGVAGHFGARAIVGVTQRWRVVLEGEVGAAVVAGVAVQYRHPRGKDAS